MLGVKMRIGEIEARVAAEPPHLAHHNLSADRSDACVHDQRRARANNDTDVGEKHPALAPVDHPDVLRHLANLVLSARRHSGGRRPLLRRSDAAYKKRGQHRKHGDSTRHAQHDVHPLSSGAQHWEHRGTRDASSSRNAAEPPSSRNQSLNLARLGRQKPYSDNPLMQDWANLSGWKPRRPLSASIKVAAS